MTINEDSGSRKRRNISRGGGISRDIVTQRHPLNVKPSGNALIYNDSKLLAKKAHQLGDLHIFNDELLLDLLGFIDDEKDLKNLSHCSKVLYAFVYDEQLWRSLYMKKAFNELKIFKTKAPIYPLNISKWRGSWRKTMLGLNEEANLQLEENLLCSDVLFRPYQCSQINYKELFKDLIFEEELSWKLKETQNKKYGIKRISEDLLTNDLFNSKHYLKPFILTTDNKERWPTWTLDELCKRFANVQFRQEAVTWPLNFYSQYFAKNQDESPLYLFDCQSKAIKELSNEYKVPKIFENDLFKLFNTVTCRPDHRWLIAGPERSGSKFHLDPNFTSAWNANVSGMKLWIMLPPNIKPPGVGTDEDESEVTSPLGIAEWILSGFYNDSIKLALDGKCLIGITFPGECIFVPSGWWHSVINLEDSIALTQNFVPTGVLPQVLNFLKNKKDQISGFHLDDFIKSLKTFIKENPNIESREIFEKFLNDIANKEIDHEDIGELCSDDLNLPIYEFFIELIKQDENYNKILPNALEKLKQIEIEKLKNKPKTIVQSKIWDELTKQAIKTNKEPESAFSFNFEESDDE
ncbi:F-box protein [Wickerhamomyces ciferrii]|uniref:F-box protein n=1 Tax=Wickerhamomyces ciferrii (strain ATCC 14091 / BCRC 22168 / CBS 111 / JCM 3599 / NBRC 0793 / NRRL Y-1031 F-60-10) TaxID=1206466 RepID=K0KH69_WICCF|nr:F-box protein [Wickerhamomyces ciferrii]CCH40518.1 F-box protein [Wickerhamomyces ciferrii]